MFLSQNLLETDRLCKLNLYIIKAKKEQEDMMEFLFLSFDGWKDMCKKVGKN